MSASQEERLNVSRVPNLGSWFPIYIDFELTRLCIQKNNIGTDISGGIFVTCLQLLSAESLLLFP